MPKAKIAITIDESSLRSIDRLVAEQQFANRSQAIQRAVDEKLERDSRGRLERECGKLEVASEQALADQGMEGELAQWPEY